MTRLRPDRSCNGDAPAVMQPIDIATLRNHNHGGDR